MDQWAWSKGQAIQNMGITMVIGGIVGGACFASVGPITRRVEERKLLLIFGLLPLVFGKIVMIPMGTEFPQMLANVSKEEGVYEWWTIFDKG